MTINPEAVMTPTRLSCRGCGGNIKGFYCVLLCDQCLELLIPNRQCEVCGKVSKHHPRMSRFVDGRYRDDNGKLLEPRYWCSEHAHLAP